MIITDKKFSDIIQNFITNEINAISALYVCTVRLLKRLLSNGEGSLFSYTKIIERRMIKKCSKKKIAM